MVSMQIYAVNCVRKILRIQPAYYSRIANADVLAKIGDPMLSDILLERQLGFFGTLARRPLSCPVRRLVFTDNLEMKPYKMPRRRGRPKLEWAHELSKIVGSIFHSHVDFCTCVAEMHTWRDRIRSFMASRRPAVS